MKKTALFLIAACLFGAAVQAVPTDEIAALRQNLAGGGVTLTDADRAVIDRFWRIALDAMLLSDDPAQLVSIGRQVQQEKGTEPLSFYATGYVRAGRTHLQTAFETVAKWEASEKKTLVERNLMILTALLQSPLLAELGLERLSHADEVVRYWAVKSVASTALAQQLTDTATGDAVLTGTILKALAERVGPEPSLEILRNIVVFAAMVNREEARDILLAAAQRRIQAYMSWNVDNEQFDAVLLKAMGQIVLGERESEQRAATARRFAELFSMLFQRYLAEPSPLTEEQKAATAAVIAEVDNQILAKALGVPQTGVIRALQRRSGLDKEYEDIFGSTVGAGKLATRLSFNYGKAPDGKVINSPPKLPTPPAPPAPQP